MIMSPNPKKPEAPLCAVEGCTIPGKPQICPADGAYHGHGCIHFEHCHSTLIFRKNTHKWHWICDEHYAICVAARDAWECSKERSKEGA